MADEKFGQFECSPGDATGDKLTRVTEEVGEVSSGMCHSKKTGAFIAKNAKNTTAFPALWYACE